MILSAEKIGDLLNGGFDRNLYGRRVRIEVIRFERFASSLAIAIDLGRQRHHTRCDVPIVLPLRFGHLDELPER